jgi:hypothetical protein
MGNLRDNLKMAIKSMETQEALLKDDLAGTSLRLAQLRVLKNRLDESRVVAEDWSATIYLLRETKVI